MSYRIDPRLPLTAEVRRIAGDQLDEALRQLAAVHDGPDKALHECRKSLKNVRALLRLVRSGNEDFTRAENDRYREAAALLAGPRAAGAFIETADRLMKEFSGHAQPLAALRERLRARRDLVMSESLDEAVRAATGMCRAGIERLEALVLPDGAEDAAEVLVRGARKTLRRAQDALHAVKTHGRASDFHDLRKAAKAHVMHLSLLKEFWPAPIKARRKAFAALAEQLGELHDIVVLRKKLHDERTLLGSAAETREVDRLCMRMKRMLEKMCVKQAAALLKDDSKSPVRKKARKTRREFVRAQSTAP